MPATDTFPIDTPVVVQRGRVEDCTGIWIVRRTLQGTGEKRLSRVSDPGRVHTNLTVNPAHLRYASAAEIAAGYSLPASSTPDTGRRTVTLRPSEVVDVREILRIADHGLRLEARDDPAGDGIESRRAIRDTIAAIRAQLAAAPMTERPATGPQGDERPQTKE